MSEIIREKGGLIIDCCVDYELSHRLIRETTKIPEVGGYKLSALKFITKGLEKWMENVRNHTDKPIILDGQKWGNDVPEKGEVLMGELEKLKEFNIGGVILFPYSGPVTQVKWTEAAQKRDIPVIIGGEMTHEGIKREDGGYFTTEDFMRMYLLGIKTGVRNFVLPGNKPEQIRTYRNLIKDKLGTEATYFSPGFEKVSQIQRAAKAAGKKFHPIVGGMIYTAPDFKQATLNLVSKLY